MFIENIICVIMKLISVVVPIYKVEQYLNRCVESIVNQTYKNLEIILVDDGSPDNCGMMCDAWAGKDSRIKVIHKPNGGLSEARNAGLKIALGEYIAFVDSDDWVATDYLNFLMEAMHANECDIVECNIIRTDGEPVPVCEVDENLETTVYGGEAALEQLIKDGDFHQYVWNKLYKRSVIGDIFFEKGKTNEDEFWTYQVFGNAKKVGKITAGLYYYLQRPTSIMGVGYSLKRLDALEAKLERQKYIEIKYPSLKDIAGTNLYTSCIYQGQMSLLYLNGEELKKAKRRINSIIKRLNGSVKTYTESSISERVWINAAKVTFWGTCGVKNLLRKGV